MHRDCPLDCKVYVGNLGSNGNKTELERSFGYYGPLRSVWVARNPPGFAFVEFEDARDANDAVRELDGRSLCGSRVRVELSSGEKRSRNRGPPPSWNRRPRDDRRRSPTARRRQLVLFQHHVTTDQRAQISLAGVVSHDPGLASRQVAPVRWFLSMPFSTSNLYQNGSSPLHNPDQSAFYVPKSLHYNLPAAAFG
ncbi:hypothetical protein NHX12_030196 [Muraenolepis orangiensis]|uniref:RRM domain-containing protein n=1 Tax=Muraenolepis orangiensis TaxID=630683 RepID=A0A9Q0IMJ6_9TELE|nr:hypothetical protein NHX12_030196 [Muraenolepis orangiensis]